MSKWGYSGAERWKSIHNSQLCTCSRNLPSITQMRLLKVTSTASLSHSPIQLPQTAHYRASAKYRVFWLDRVLGGNSSLFRPNSSNTITETVPTTALPRCQSFTQPNYLFSPTPLYVHIEAILPSVRNFVRRIFFPVANPSNPLSKI